MSNNLQTIQFEKIKNKLMPIITKIEFICDDISLFLICSLDFLIIIGKNFLKNNSFLNIKKIINSLPMNNLCLIFNYPENNELINMSSISNESYTFLNFVIYFNHEFCDTKKLDIFEIKYNAKKYNFDNNLFEFLKNT